MEKRPGLAHLKGTWGSSCGSAGKAVASYTRDLRFESNHQEILFSITFIERRKFKHKRGRERPNLGKKNTRKTFMP